MVRSCTVCANAVYDDTWGEYKCLVYKNRILAPEWKNDCEEFTAGNPHKTGYVGAHTQVKEKQTAEYNVGYEDGYAKGKADGFAEGYAKALQEREEN